MLGTLAKATAVIPEAAKRLSGIHKHDARD
jgi:hypothetical protein